MRLSYNSTAYEPETVDLTKAEAEAKFAALVARSVQIDGKLLDELILEVSEQAEHPAPWLPTGLGPLDHLLDGGLRGGEVFVLAARPGVGKSAFALQVVLTVARSVPVAIWSLEMKPVQWLRRAICALSGIQPRRLRRGELKDGDYPLFAQAAGDLSKLKIRFARGDSTPTGFALEAEGQAATGCGLLVVDYLQLMRPEKGAYNRENEVAIAMRSMKQVALEENVCVLLLAQLNRNAEGKAPTLSDLRESGSIEQDADEVFFLHRERDTDRHVLAPTGAGILAKNRDGETGSFALRYDGQRYHFYPIDRTYEPPGQINGKPIREYGDMPNAEPYPKTRRDYGND